MTISLLPPSTIRYPSSISQAVIAREPVTSSWKLRSGHDLTDLDRASDGIMDQVRRIFGLALRALPPHRPTLLCTRCMWRCHYDIGSSIRSQSASLCGSLSVSSHLTFWACKLDQSDPFGATPSWSTFRIRCEEYRKHPHVNVLRQKQGFALMS